MAWLQYFVSYFCCRDRSDWDCSTRQYPMLLTHNLQHHSQFVNGSMKMNIVSNVPRSSIPKSKTSIFPVSHVFNLHYLERLRTSASKCSFYKPPKPEWGSGTICHGFRLFWRPHLRHLIWFLPGTGTTKSFLPTDLQGLSVGCWLNKNKMLFFE